VSDRKRYLADEGWLPAAIVALRNAGLQVIAPVRDEKGAVNLAPVAEAGDVTTDYVNVQLPLKRVLFPATESLLSYEKSEGGDVDMQPAPEPSGDEAAVIGCRPCDAAALEILDAVFQWDYDDIPYRGRRDKLTVVSFACSSPDEHCFCTSVGGSPHGVRGSDVVVYECDGGSLLEPQTERGEQLIEKLADGVRPAPDDAQAPSPPEVAPRFDTDKVKRWLDDHFESEFWVETSLACLGCGACSFLCPTCHCFDIVDEAAWNRGERRRNWDCCSFGQFTVHGSGHNPRPVQSARCRQRVMHKFKYFPDRFERIACVGCGRCIRACGVGRNLAHILAEIETK